jgi:hypothetical protein
MWTTLDRARRRLIGERPAPASHATAAPIEAPAATVATLEVVMTLGRVEFDRLVTAVGRLLGATDGRPDTPVQLEAALRVLITRIAGTGTPSVVRRPPGLYTPESWRVTVDAADERTRTALVRAVRDGEIT